MYNNSVVARLKPGIEVSQADVESVPSVQQRGKHIPQPQGLAEGRQRIGGVSPTMKVGRARTLLFVLFAAVGGAADCVCGSGEPDADSCRLAATRDGCQNGTRGGTRSAVRQTLVESALLAGVGAALGLAVTWWVVGVLVAAAPETLPRLGEVQLDARVLGFTAFLSVATAILCGLLPALEATRSGASDSLKEGGRTAARWDAVNGASSAPSSLSNSRWRSCCSSAAACSCGVSTAF